MGLSFAIPIDVAMNIVDAAQGEGPRDARPHRRADPGSDARKPPRRSASTQPTGALVNSVEKGGPADKAGVEAGDIILKFDGKRRATRRTTCRGSSRAVQPGTKVTLHGLAQGQRSASIAVDVAEMKEDARGDAARAARPGAEGEGASPTGWASCCPTSPTSRRRSSRSRPACWSRTSPASVRGNVQPGDVILAIVSSGATTEAKSAEQFNELLAKLEKGASVTLQMKRGEQQFFATIAR